MPSASTTVLIVDDDPGVLNTFTRMLQLEGYNVLTALDGATAWHEASTAHPQAILLDVHMPGADGLIFLQRLRASEWGRQTPVAVITGDYSIDPNLAQRFHGLDVVMRFKPLWLHDLVAIVDGLLSTDRDDS